MSAEDTGLREALEAACLEGLVETEHGYRYRPAVGAEAVLRVLAEHQPTAREGGANEATYCGVEMTQRDGIARVLREADGCLTDGEALSMATAVLLWQAAQPAPVAPAGEVRLSIEDQDDVIRALFDPDDDCAHNLVPLFRFIEQRVAVAWDEGYDRAGNLDSRRDNNPYRREATTEGGA